VLFILGFLCNRLAGILGTTTGAQFVFAGCS
jgi:hypothetical protein